EIALNLNMSLRVVQRVLQLYKELGDVMKDPHMYQRCSPPPVLNPTACDYMLKLLEEKPDLYLDEIALELNDVTGLDISISTVHRSLKLLGITSKRLSKTTLERCHMYCMDFSFKITGEPADHLVFTDESTINTLTSSHNMG
ncbi:hypothetical protein K439DRAFT_1266627, partial [Ramaria rubella]